MEQAKALRHSSMETAASNDTKSNEQCSENDWSSFEGMGWVSELLANIVRDHAASVCSIVLNVYPPCLFYIKCVIIVLTLGHNSHVMETIWKNDGYDGDDCAKLPYWQFRRLCM